MLTRRMGIQQNQRHCLSSLRKRIIAQGIIFDSFLSYDFDCIVGKFESKPQKSTE